MIKSFQKIGFVLAFSALTITTTFGMGQEIKPKPKKHKCTSACVNGKHMYKHGEKGHVCNESCGKKM